MRILATLAALLLATPAAAQEYSKTINYSLPAGKTFAIRSLCLEYGLYLHVYRTGNWGADLGNNDGYCVNGRTGVTFTVPPGAATQLVTLTAVWDYPPKPDLKIQLDPDCRGDAATTCVLKAVLDSSGNHSAQASGRFTWPGDEDWYRINGDLGIFRTTTPRDTCVAVGKVVVIGEVEYLILSGGPAGCTYTVTARNQPTT